MLGISGYMLEFNFLKPYYMSTRFRGDGDGDHCPTSLLCGREYIIKFSAPVFAQMVLYYAVSLEDCSGFRAQFATDKHNGAYNTSPQRYTPTQWSVVVFSPIGHARFFFFFFFFFFFCSMTLV